MNQINTFWTKTYTPIKLFNPKNRSFLYYQVSMENSGTIKGILIFFAIVVSFYILKILSFIFIPLISAIFLALLFMPLMRWLNRKKVPKWVSVTISAIIMLSVLFASYQLIRLSANQIVNGQTEFWEKVDTKLQTSWSSIGQLLEINLTTHDGNGIAKDLLASEKISNWVTKNFGNTVGFIQRLVVTILMILFFLILLLADSLNVQRLFGTLIFNRKNSSVKAFMAIEESIVKFIQVKSLTSLITGAGFWFDLSFLWSELPPFLGANCLLSQLHSDDWLGCGHIFPCSIRLC